MKTVFAWLICSLIWGTTWVFIKIGLADLPPLSFAALRFVVASFVIVLMLAALGISFPKTKRDWFLILPTGLLTFGLNYALVFWGETQISSGLAAVLQSTIPVFGLIFAKFYLPDEQITTRKVLAILLGLAGVATIFYEQLQISGFWALMGCLALVVSATSAAFANVLIKTFAVNIHPLSLTAGQMVIGLVPLCLAGLITEGNPLNFNWTWRAVVCVFYLAIVGSIIAFWLYYWVLNRIEATKAMMIAFVSPIIAVIVGWIALSEQLPAQTALGGALVLASVALVLFRFKKKEAILLEEGIKTEG
ncbi:MAG: EamA family transporter [Acidobacteriota bacterium]|nr:EamA family transporter [Acidobacteriota bacterium]